MYGEKEVSLVWIFVSAERVDEKDNKTSATRVDLGESIGGEG